MNPHVIYPLLVVWGTFEVLLFAGLIFGWASLVYILKLDSYFDLCTPSENTEPTNINDYYHHHDTTINRYVKLFLRSSKLLRHNFCAWNSKLHKKVKHQARPISLFVNRSGSFMDQ